MSAALTSDKDQAKVSLLGVPDTPGVAARIFQEIADTHINIDMIIQNISHEGTTDVSFTVAKKDLEATLKNRRNSQSQNRLSKHQYR